MVEGRAFLDLINSFACLKYRLFIASSKLLASNDTVFKVVLFQQVKFSTIFSKVSSF